MGRVDDALRRARGELDTPVPADPAPEALEAAPAALDLPSEPAAPAPPTPVAAPPAMNGVTKAVNGKLLDESPILADRLSRGLSGKVVVDRDIVPASREQYRRLAATLLHNQAMSGLKVVMVTSAAVGEGKSLTASNLAMTFSESYMRRVLLIDADLRRPSLQGVFGFESTIGLSEVLMLPEERRLTVHHVSRHLSVVPAGAPSSDPMAGLSSERMRRVIDEAREAFDWVIVDTPPVGLLSDASLIAAMVDGVVLVVRAGSTSYEQVQRAIAAVGRDRVLGVVLNKVAADGSPTYYAYGQYYGASRSAP